MPVIAGHLDMSLSAILKPQFNAGDRSRGTSYFSSGAVYSMSVDHGFLEAEVDGSDCHYLVTLDVDDILNSEAISCTCPRFDDGYYCKHIWATILKYESTLSRSAIGSTKQSRRSSKKKVTKKPAKRKPIPQWKSLLQQVAIRDQKYDSGSASPLQSAVAKQAEVHYVIDASDESRYEPPMIQLGVWRRVKKANGEWGKLKPLSLSHYPNDELSESTDEKISALLMGAERNYTDPYGYRMAIGSFSKFEVDSNWPNELCELLVSSGRLHWTLGMELSLDNYSPVEFIDLAANTEICIEVTEQAKPKHSALMEVFIKKDGQRIDNGEVVKISDNGIVLLTKGIVQISNPEAIDFWLESHGSPPVTIAKKERSDFLNQLSMMNGLPRVKLPDTWKVEQSDSALEPTAILKLHNVDRIDNEFSGEMIFTYGETEFPLTAPNTVVYDENENCWSERNFESELKLLQQITAFPITDTTEDRFADHDFRINKKHLVRIVDELGSDGWKIVLLGKPIKQAGEFNISVESGQDWFDLSAEVSFDGETIPLPGLLQAISEKSILLRWPMAPVAEFPRR